MGMVHENEKCLAGSQEDSTTAIALILMTKWHIDWEMSSRLYGREEGVVQRWFSEHQKELQGLRFGRLNSI